MRAWFLLFSLVACKSASTSAPSNDAASPPRDAARAEVDAGAEATVLFASLCAVCHGADATGYKADNAPSLVNPTFLESASDEQLRRSIVDGRPGTSMAAYGTRRGGPLGDDAIARIVTWLRSQGPTPMPMFSRGLGDPGRGAPLYASNCERCHGNAKTRSNAVHLANPRFLEVASDSFIGWAITHGRPGTPMEPWQDKLTATQIDDIVAFVRTFDKPPVLGTLPPPTGKEPIVIHPGGQNPAFKARSTPCPTSAPCAPDERFVSVDQVKQALDEKRKIVIIDARPPSEWMSVHIPGAVSIPYHDLKRVAEVPNDGTWVVAYCACPHHLSGDVVDALRKRGVRHAVVLDEGILEWHRRGYPVVAALGVERPPNVAPVPAPRVLP